jgi:hypothetical protein
MEKQKLYSETLRGNGRTYFFDMYTASNGTPYLSVTESRRDREKEGEYQSSRLVVFPEDAEAFNSAFDRLINNYRQKGKNGN